MNDSRRTKAQLLEELARLRSEIAALKGLAGRAPCPAPPSADRTEESPVSLDVVTSLLLQAPSADPIFVLDRDLRLVAANPAAGACLGATPDWLIGKTLAEVFSPPVASRRATYIRRVFETGAPFHSDEDPAETVDGPGRFSTSLLPVKDGRGEVQYVVGIARDRSDRKAAEEILRQSESNYRAVFNSVNDILFVHDIETGDAVDFNQRASEMFGFGLGEIDLLNAHFRREADPPHSYKDQMRWLRKAADGPPQVFEWLATDRNGRRFWVEVSLRRATIGARDRLLAVLRDIGDRRQAEEALRRSEEQYRLLFEQSVDGIIVGGTGGGIVSANPAMCRILGRPQNEIVGSNVLSHIHPDEVHIAKKRADLFMSGTAPLPGQVYRLVRPDGAPIWVEMRSQRLQWEGRPGFLIIARDITDRRQAEEALRRSEEQYRLLFEQSADGIVVVGPGGCLVSANPAMCRILGRPQDEVVGSNVLRHIHPDDIHTARKRFGLLMSGTAPLPGQVYRLARDDGAPVWVEVRSQPLQWEGRPGFLVVARDVTERRQAEEALRESEARYRAVVETQSELICRFTDGGILTFVNEAYCRFFGRRREELIGVSFLPMIPEADRDAARERLASINRDHPVVTHEHRGILSSGKVRWMHWTNQGLFDDQGRLVEYQALGRDVTERREAEEALRESRAELQAIYDRMGDGVLVADAETRRFVRANPAICRMLGYSRDELLALSVDDIHAPEHLPRVLEQFAEMASGRTPVARDVPCLRKDGAVFYADMAGTPLLFEERGWVVAILHDVTERREAEEALRTSEARYRAVVEDQTEMITRHTPDGVATFVNEAICRFFGKTRDQILGHAFMPHVHPDDVPLVADAIRSLTPEHPVETHENRARMPSGEVRWIQWTNRGIFDGAGRMVEIQAVGRDVTLRVRLEEELAEALKMEAIGQLAGGIAHDFNNLMTGILCHAGLLKDNPGPAEDVREAAGLIEGAARRAAELTSRLLGFARRGKLQDVPVDLNAAVETTVSLLRRSLDPRIRVRTRFQAGRAVVRGDPVQMEQVVLNLAFNARDAMPEGGDMTFTTEVRDLTEAEGAEHPRAVPGRHAVLAVQDTGCGIPDEIRDRIFEPFFTTKPPGKGTGMGLAMVYGIARNHGGWVDVDSAVGRGSTFRVFLPEAHEEAPDAEPAPAAEAMPSARAGMPAAGPGRILVVDDEALVRNVVDRMLTGLGYKVVTADDGRQAAELYQRFHRDIDLVIVDMVMPEMDGRECFHALRKIDPAVRVILSTGQGGEGTIQDVLDEGMVGFVQKPYQAAQLAEAVRRALGR